MAKTKEKQPTIETGNISVHTENIFPIIKKSLYSDHEIFLRELVSNAVDATQKISYLSRTGQFGGELGDLKIVVSVSKDAKTITIRDRGLGMTGEEIKKYINQVAFSGAEEFVEKFKDVKDAKEIIGQFGLGFYSAFMVSSTVEINTLSYQEGAEGARWTCDGSTSFTLESTDRSDRGTEITLHVAEDSLEFLESARLKTILNKYCKFLPVEIEFEGEIINTTDPIWRKTPTNLEDKDYLEFFKKLYPFAPDPLFWIHLNVDYPFELTGILYFPKVQNELEALKKDRIQLYSRQVFITDSVENIVPEYLMLLQGVIDSPDIPLNVSRSYLQTDSNVRKISNYITKKVGDKLKELFRDDRNKFIEKWGDVDTFVKYGMLSDEKFAEQALEFCLVKNTEGKYFTLAEYRDAIKDLQTDKDGKLVILYASELESQNTYIASAKKKGYDVLHLNGVLDSHFIGKMEQDQSNETWKRVDSESIDKLVAKEEEQVDILSEEQSKAVKEVFDQLALERRMMVQAAPLGEDELPIVITRPEFMRRMREMSVTSGNPNANFPEMLNLVINTSHPLIVKVAERKTPDAKEKLARQLLDLGLLSQNLLTGPSLTEFIERSMSIIR